MSWYGVAAAVVAAVGTAVQQNQVARRQDRAISQGILQRMNATRDQSSALQKSLAQLRESNAKQAVDQAKGGYLAALSHNPTMGTQPAQVGAVSDAYRQAAGAAANDSNALADKTAGLMAITDAPGIQRQAEANQIGRLQANLTGIGINANDQTAEAQLRARGVRANPWIGLATAALSAYAGGKASGAGAAAGAAGQDYSGMAGGQYNNGGDQYLTGQPSIGAGDGFSGFSNAYSRNANRLYNVGGY